ncbi:MAG: FliH/SctL family protein [Planctomycetota bacterium]
MSSSAESVRLPRVPSAVRVLDGAPVAALIARAERANTAALERARTEAAEAVRREIAADVEELVAGCRREVEAMRESMLDTAVEIAAVLAESVLQRELGADLDLSGVVRKCLASTTAEPSECTVRVHPDAVAGLERAGVAARVEVVADPELQRGEVRLDTPVGMLVHDPAAALAQARDALLAELEEGR